MQSCPHAAAVNLNIQLCGSPSPVLWQYWTHCYKGNLTNISYAAAVIAMDFMVSQLGPLKFLFISWASGESNTTIRNNRTCNKYVLHCRGVIKRLEFVFSKENKRKGYFCSHSYIKDNRSLLLLLGFNFYVSTSFICCNQDFHQVFTLENMMGSWLHGDVGKIVIIFQLAKWI